jgi:hypothetical protein
MACPAKVVNFSKSHAEPTKTVCTVPLKSRMLEVRRIQGILELNDSTL